MGWGNTNGAYLASTMASILFWRGLIPTIWFGKGGLWLLGEVEGELTGETVICIIGGFEKGL